jgi:hypothetical protein
LLGRYTVDAAMVPSGDRETDEAGDAKGDLTQID